MTTRGQSPTGVMAAEDRFPANFVAVTGTAHDARQCSTDRRRSTPTCRALRDASNSARRRRDRIPRLCIEVGQPLPPLRQDQPARPFSSTPHSQPTAADATGVTRIADLRRRHKWSASRIAFELQARGIPVRRRTVTRHLDRLGLNHRKFVDPHGEQNPEPRRISARRSGHQRHDSNAVSPTCWPPTSRGLIRP